MSREPSILEYVLTLLQRCDHSGVSTECPAWSRKTFHPLWSEPEYDPVELSLGNLQLPAYQHLFVAFHPMHVNHSFQRRVKETSIHIPGDNFLGSTFLSITLPFMLQTLQLPWTKIYDSTESTCFAYNLTPCSMVQSVLPGRKLGQSQGSSHLFISFRDHNPPLPLVQNIKAVVSNVLSSLSLSIAKW